MEKRIEWLDWTKVMAIFLVVLGHLPIDNRIIMIIYSFHMPLFFIISGFLEKGSSTRQTIKKSYKTIIIPYIVYFIITYIFWFFIVYLRNRYLYPNLNTIEAVKKPFIGMLLGVGYDTEYSMIINTPLWFLIGLFFCRIYFSIILKIVKENLKILLILNIVIILLVVVLKKINIDLLWSIDSALLALPFYSFGYSMKYFKIEKYRSIINIISVFFISLILTLFISYINGRVDINGFDYGKNIIYFYINGIFGTITIIMLGLLLEKIKTNLITLLSTGTIVIMALHNVTQIYIVNLFKPYKSIFIYNDIFYIIIAFIIVLLHIIPILIIMRWFPFLVGKKRKDKINA